MTMPAYVSKGTASAPSWDSCLGTFDFSVTAPGVINAGDIIVYAIFVTVLGANTVDGFSAPAGFTEAYSTGIGANKFRYVGYKVAAGTEDSSSITAQISSTGGGTALGQCYVFSGSGTGGYHAVGGTNSGTSTSPAFASLTTTEANELAVGFVFAEVSSGVAESTGETGGNWVEKAEDVTGLRTIELQTANMASAATISGGSSTISSAAWTTFNFALKEIGGAAGIPNKVIGSNFAVKRANFF